MPPRPRSCAYADECIFVIYALEDFQDGELKGISVKSWHRLAQECLPLSHLKAAWSPTIFASRSLSLDMESPNAVLGDSKDFKYSIRDTTGSTGQGNKKLTHKKKGDLQKPWIWSQLIRSVSGPGTPTFAAGVWSLGCFTEGPALNLWGLILTAGSWVKCLHWCMFDVPACLASIPPSPRLNTPNFLWECK